MVFFCPFLHPSSLTMARGRVMQYVLPPETVSLRVSSMIFMRLSLQWFYVIFCFLMDARWQAMNYVTIT
jgi:hypothetical protein